MLFDFDIDIIVPNLIPPVKRLPKYLAWCKAITIAVQTNWQNLFVDFKTGSSYADYDALTIYNLGDKVRWTDKAIYEATQNFFGGTSPANSDYWVKVNDIFIGVDERIKYNSQKILFEYALNKYFVTTGIYIQNNFVTVANNFVMNTGSQSSSVMPLNSHYQIDYMNLNASYNTDIYDYTIFVPIAYYTSLGTNADGIIRGFADKYNLAGMQYDIQTY